MKECKIVNVKKKLNAYDVIYKKNQNAQQMLCQNTVLMKHVVREIRQIPDVSRTKLATKPEPNTMHRYKKDWPGETWVDKKEAPLALL